MIAIVAVYLFCVLDNVHPVLRSNRQHESDDRGHGGSTGEGAESGHATAETSAGTIERMTQADRPPQLVKIAFVLDGGALTIEGTVHDGHDEGVEPCGLK
jgi:hypothetical protein